MLTVCEVTASGSKLTFGDTTLTAVLGYAVVFAGLLALMAIVYCMGAIFKALGRRKKQAAAKGSAAPKPAGAPAPAAKAAAPAVPEGPAAPGSAGQVKRFDVPDKEAAMIMAIVADNLGKPLNELRFLSIKEVK